MCQLVWTEHHSVSTVRCLRTGDLAFDTFLKHVFKIYSVIHRIPNCILTNVWFTLSLFQSRELFWVLQVWAEL